MMDEPICPKCRLHYHVGAMRCYHCASIVDWSQWARMYWPAWAMMAAVIGGFVVMILCPVWRDFVGLD